MVIKGVEEQWALENHKRIDEIPTWADIAPYFTRGMPQCPQGGTYTLGRVDEEPRCCGQGDQKEVSLSPETVVGSYMGKYSDGASESFVIRPDGTFVQSLSVSNRIIYTNSGKWEISARDGGFVDFHDVLLAKVWKTKAGEPSKWADFPAFWHPNGPMIIFADEEHFWIEKHPNQRR